MSLIETTGPFLSLPVLQSTWPALDALEKPAREQLRQEHAVWQSDPELHQQVWLEYLLGDLLGWGEALHWQHTDDLTSLTLKVPEHNAHIAADFVLVDPEGEPQPATARLLGMVCPAGVHPTARVAGDSWSASPADRLAQLCRAHDVPLGLVTDGRWWALIRAPRQRTTTTAIFDAVGWNEAAERDVVRAFLSLLCRRRFFGVPESETLPALLEASMDSQEEITESLGVQVRQAVELLVAAIGRADTAQRERQEQGLVQVDADEIYHASVIILMRIVFLLFAEERKMLPADNELYAAAYSAGRLCNALEQRAVYEGEDELEHSFTAWHQLLALFHAVYFGIDHPRLHIYPHDGPLFDSTRFPWLPSDIDNRTVLHILRSVQYVETGTGRLRERRKLSFRELDVEQIGYVYEGLLAYSAYRADEVTLGLIGTPGKEREVPLRELEDLATASADVSELATQIAGKYSGSGLGSAKRLVRRLAPNSAIEREQYRRGLLSVTRGDHALTERLLPFAELIRSDLRGLPTVLLPGELLVTESPLRKNTGTHYTPRHLAEEVVSDALAPLIYRYGPLDTAARSEWEPKSSTEILELKIADIAMGSGAFLVSAARYLGARLVEAWAREGDDRATAAKISQVLGNTEEDPVVIEARRQVIEHCLYGVDINPIAVEMAKLSLWLVSTAPEKPFTFLDDRLVSGDSLLGVTSLDQLEHMHFDPDQGKQIHHDLFAWTDSIQAKVAKAADTRRRITDLELLGDPLEWLDDRRKLLRESQDDLHDLQLIGDLLIGGLLKNASDGERGLTRGVVRAAQWGTRVIRDNAVDLARQQAEEWLYTGQPEIGFARRPLHWPLVFADVFEGDAGGFDAVIGNQPYLGGQKLTAALGRAYREFLVHTVGGNVRGSADLIAYFVLRTHALLKPEGQAALIATNTLAQGDTREVGLDQLHDSGVTIRRSIKSEPWPSRSAALEYCAVWTSRRPLGEQVECVADGVPVRGITPSLDPESRVTGNPERLAANAGISFQGSNILGLGFTMAPDEAQALMEKDPRNAEVLFPYLNGQDLNSRTDCSASRWVINFHDWPEEQAKKYPDCYEQVRRLVKPERDKNKRKVYRDYWWQYAEKRPAMVQSIAELDRVVVIARVSRTAMPVMINTGQVFNEKIVVFATEDTAIFALLSSAPHYRWAVARSATLKTDLQYAPSDAFETFPLPELTAELRELGDRLDTYRRDVMLSRESGLTKTYNLVFDPACTDEDIEELRRIHRAIDEATIRAYGWEDRIEDVGGLDHGFHRVGRETRYTIGPAAQREILDSLLELNHERYAEEVAQGLHDKKKGKRQAPGEQGTLLC